MSSYIGGMFTGVQTDLIAVITPIFNNTQQPLQDPNGVTLTVPVVADYPDATLSDELAGTQALIHVGLETGALRLFRGYGKAGHDSTGQNWRHTAYATDCKGVFTIYTVKDYLRRWLADWLQWGLLTSWATDPTGVRLHGYLLTVLRQCGISPRIDPLFDAVEYPEPDLSEPRPAGLPYRARVKLRCNIEVNWLTPVLNVTGKAVLLPNNAGPNLLPITIPLP